jgi:hypothetical protein
MAGEISRQLKYLEKELDPKRLAQEAFKYFKQITPEDTGNAKRKTTLNGDTINAQYPYAGRLDQGYSSQAPQGMTKPTEEHMKKHIAKLPK